MRKIKKLYRWYINGDHPDDTCEVLESEEGRKFLSEGKVVRRFRHPYIPGDSHCKICGNIMHLHGWIDQGIAGITVCPGDYIVKLENKYYAIHMLEQDCES